ncbi:N,N-dimethylformamidase beta subunit family domain-containing protein [Dongia sp.]|uniref:N,N-dimethylformamidase beta subunit family domain-containing protein n=1 Tax=Dongia sp. TaxID=1977262 RepID=UPI00375031E5
MRRPVDHAALPAAGYFTELSVAAGGQAPFHLSSAGPAPRARILRLDRAHDPESTDWLVTESAAYPGVQSLDLGAWLAIRPPDRLLNAAEWTLAFEFRLAGTPAGRVLVAGAGMVVRFAGDGAMVLEGADAVAGQILPSGSWLNARLCRRRDGLSLTVTKAGREIASLFTAPNSLPAGILHLGSDLAGSVPTLNVGIGRIALRDAADQVIAAWRFPAIGRPRQLAPVEGDGVLEIHNAPSFGLRSARWDGSLLDPRLAPAHYDAVALHDDDLADAGWPETHRVAVPGSAEPGVYAVEVATAMETRRFPFFVTPKQRQADLVFLVPTFTYLAYADERLPPERFPWVCDDAGHRFAKANNLTSLYDTHNDGSGVSLAGFRRPLATLRDDYLYPLCGAPHLLPVDLNLLRFLHGEGIRIDLLTDADLDRGGVGRLQGYRGLVTGSHPEYWTGVMRDALDGFRATGGHIAYLGGNGGYWVTGFDGDTIEVRRGLSGIRTWSSEPGETHLAMTGEPGGLWRHRGRAEHQLLGTGLQAMGFSRAQPFHRTPESYAPDLAWLFDGVGDAPIGETGIVLGGAAGYEIDARSPRWMTPADTRLLAVAQGFDAGYAIDSDATEDGLPVPARGEMTLTQGAVGWVFAASSVSWCGALPQAGSMNAVGRITANLLRRFTR